MATAVYNSPLFHADDATGAPLVGGLLYTYLTGTTTPATTYQDAAGSTPNTNPIVLNARGEATVFLTAGTVYTFALKDSLGASVYTADGVSSPLSSGSLSGYAPLASPSFTGTPTAPTPVAGDSSTRLATTAFVESEIATAVGGTNKGAGQCQLAISGGTLLLSRFAGKYLTINGSLREIPSSGVSLSITSEVANTTYYVYASWSGTAIALSSSATSYVTDTATGMPVMSGDATNTLVGMVRTNSSPAWSLCRSYFNDPGQAIKASFTADRGTSSTTFAEINSEIRVGFLCWADEIVRAGFTGGSLVDLGGGDSGYGYVSIGFDGATAEDCGVVVGPSVTGGLASQDWFPSSASIYRSGLTAGYHYATIVAHTVVTGGGGFSIYCNGSATAGERTTLSIYVKR